MAVSDTKALSAAFALMNSHKPGAFMPLTLYVRLEFKRSATLRTTHSTCTGAGHQTLNPKPKNLNVPNTPQSTFSRHRTGHEAERIIRQQRWVGGTRYE